MQRLAQASRSFRMLRQMPFGTTLMAVTRRTTPTKVYVDLWALWCQGMTPVILRESECRFARHKGEFGKYVVQDCTGYMELLAEAISVSVHETPGWFGVMPLVTSASDR